jgi:hypothetical protein
MASIGSHFALLLQVQIDADAVCPHDCYANVYHDSLDLLPLLRVIWANPDARCDITFVHTGRFLDDSIHLPRRIDDGIRLPINIMNSILVTLGKINAHNIKQYAKFVRLLASVQPEKRGDGVAAFAVHRSSDSGIHVQHVFR